MKTFRYTIRIYIQSLRILASENISICHKHSQSSSTWPKGKIYVIRRSTITHNYMSAQMHVTKHDYRKLSLSASIHPLLAIAPASNPNPNHPFSFSSFYRASTLLHLDPLSLPAAKGHFAQEGVLTLPTATGQWRYFPIPSPIFLVRWE